jgi:hypothetical protein
VSVTVWKAVLTDGVGLSDQKAQKAVVADALPMGDNVNSHIAGRSKTIAEDVVYVSDQVVLHPSKVIISDGISLADEVRGNRQNIRVSQAYLESVQAATGAGMNRRVSQAHLEVVYTVKRIDLVFRYSDATNYWLLRADFGVQQLQLIKNVNGTLTTVDTAAVTLDEDTEYDLEVTLSGSTIEGFLDGVSEVTATDAHNSTETIVGMGVNTSDARCDEMVAQGDWVDLSADLLKVNWNRGRDAELEQTTPGSCELMLRNYSGDYSPENSGSPYYGLLKPGVEVRVRSVAPVAKGQFLGYVEDVIPESDPRNQTCYLRAVDGAAKALSTKTIRTPLTPSYRTGAALGDLLDRANWPGGKRSLDAGQSLITQWWVHDEDAWAGGQELVEAEAGLFVINGAGIAVFEDRTHRRKGAHLAALSTLTATMVEMDYQQRLREIYNEVNVKVYALVGGTENTELWRLREYPILSTSTRTFLTIGGAEVTATAIFYPEFDEPSTIDALVASTHYAANTSADGLGEDITDQLTVTLEQSHAVGCMISVTNAGPKSGYITLLKMTGQPFPQSDPVTVSQGDAASQMKYGRRTMTVDNRLIQVANIAQDLADYMTFVFKEGRAYTRVKLVNDTAANVTAMLSREISDRVTITEPNTGVNGDYFIERIQFKVEGSVTECVWLLSQADPLGNYLILDDATSGKLNTGRLSY